MLTSDLVAFIAWVLANKIGSLYQVHAMLDRWRCGLFAKVKAMRTRWHYGRFAQVRHIHLFWVKTDDLHTR